MERRHRVGPSKYCAHLVAKIGFVRRSSVSSTDERMPGPEAELAMAQRVDQIHPGHANLWGHLTVTSPGGRRPGIARSMIQRREMGEAMVNEKPIKISAVTVEPLVIRADGTAMITVHAHSDRGWPLEYEVSASEGFIEPTEAPNIFLWHGPKSRRGRTGLLRSRA